MLRRNTGAGCRRSRQNHTLKNHTLTRKLDSLDHDEEEDDARHVLDADQENEVHHANMPKSLFAIAKFVSRRLGSCSCRAKKMRLTAPE